MDYSLVEPWLMSALYVQIKVKLKWTSHESRARSGSGIVHTWPGVGLRAYDILFSRRRQLLNVTLLIFKL